MFCNGLADPHIYNINHMRGAFGPFAKRLEVTKGTIRMFATSFIRTAGLGGVKMSTMEESSGLRSYCLPSRNYLRKVDLAGVWNCSRRHRSRIVIAALVSFDFLLLTGCPAPPASNNGNEEVTTVRLHLVADGLVAPLGMAIPPDESNRLFILDQVGVVRIVDADGHLLAEPFLDLRDRIVEIMPAYDERGLLGMAFHPDYAENGRFFITYNAPPPGDGGNVDYPVDSLERLSEFQITTDANVAEASSERILLELAKPQFNHNGGHLAFGPTDGFLYVSFGDGGAANDTGDGHNPEIGNGQDSSTFFGKILRIDVDGGDPYAIPADNPFVSDPDYRPEIWALGFRNPWRFSFDRQDPSRMFIADVGQSYSKRSILESRVPTMGGFARGNALLQPTNANRST
jgi:glucose/arabinose dehydrogenase